MRQCDEAVPALPVVKGLRKMPGESKPGFDLKLAQQFSELMQHIVALGTDDPMVARATYEECGRRFRLLIEAGLVPGVGDLEMEAHSAALSATLSRSEGIGRTRKVLPKGDKRRDSLRKDFVILTLLEKDGLRAIGVNELLVALETATLDVPRASLITKLNRLKKDVEYLAWDDSSQATDIRITDAGRKYLKQLRERRLPKSDVDTLSAAVEVATEELG